MPKPKIVDSNSRKSSEESYSDLSQVFSKEKWMPPVQFVQVSIHVFSLIHNMYPVSSSERKLLSRKPWNTGARSARICRESSLTKASRIILFRWSASMLAGLPPARTGSGRARVQGQGTSPLQVLRAAP